MKNKKILPIEKVNAFIEDEKMASAEYAKLGFPQLARDEAKHHKFWITYKKKNYK